MVGLLLLGCDDGGGGTAQQGADGAVGGDLGAGADGATGGDADGRVDGAATDGAVGDDTGGDAPLPDGAVGADGATHDAAPPADGAIADAAPPDPCLAAVVRVGEIEVFAYEASRLDATAEGAGEDATRACSVAGVVPWTGMALEAAQAACGASGFEVCDAATWFRVCGGDDPDGPRLFPYGDAYVNARCNDHISGGGALEVTGSRPMCRTPEGAYDMSGNVWELVVESERRGASWKVGAATFHLDAAQCDARFDVPPAFWAEDLGFRCCRRR